MPLDLFYGPAVCLDVSHVPPRTDITAEHLDAAEAAGGEPVRPGRHPAAAHRHAPAGTRASARYLTDFPGLGESGSKWIVGPPGQDVRRGQPHARQPGEQDYPCHMMCRAHHITHYENLTNLHQLVGTRFTFVGFPLKIRGGHGGPTRAVAILP